MRISLSTSKGDPLDRFYANDGEPLDICRQWAPHAPGYAMESGHFFPKESSEDIAVVVKQFLSALSQLRPNLRVKRPKVSSLLRAIDGQPSPRCGVGFSGLHLLTG